MDDDFRRMTADAFPNRESGCILRVTMDPSLITLLAGAALTVAAVVAYLILFRRTLLDTIEEQRGLVAASAERWFAVQPCFRCYESEMRLLEVSPNGRSIHYQCAHCKKKMHAPASTPDAPKALEQYRTLTALVEQYRERTAHSETPEADLGEVIFFAPAALLPYEQSSRTRIPEPVRSEVWRRDGGQCAKCGSKHNLQFDHIIPVSRGGANSVANIQLLCLACNAAKGDRV